MTAPRQLDLLFDAYSVEERVSARARSIRIEVHSANLVRLTIPRFASKSEAREFLLSREQWIREKIIELRLRIAEAPAMPSSHLRWDGSDRITFRGAEMALKLVPARLRTPSVRFADDAVLVYASSAWQAQPRRLDRVLREAIKQQAMSDAHAMLREEAKRLDVSYRGPRIADQKTLWGSCAANGTISLSWRLVMAPPVVFRYVVIHELCHLRHHDHSERFWRLVQRQMPDFERHRRWLRENGPQLHWPLKA
jgi:predicted metal-dependent hydrolase